MTETTLTTPKLQTLHGDRRRAAHLGDRGRQPGGGPCRLPGFPAGPPGATRPEGVTVLLPADLPAVVTTGSGKLALQVKAWGAVRGGSRAGSTRQASYGTATAGRTMERPAPSTVDPERSWTAGSGKAEPLGVKREGRTPRRASCRRLPTRWPTSSTWRAFPAGLPIGGKVEALPSTISTAAGWTSTIGVLAGRFSLLFPPVAPG